VDIIEEEPRRCLFGRAHRTRRHVGGQAPGAGDAGGRDVGEAEKLRLRPDKIESAGEIRHHDLDAELVAEPAEAGVQRLRMQLGQRRLRGLLIRA
jgi:hypothetical protein